MSDTPTVPNVQGLPPGAIVKPMTPPATAPPASVQGLPPGAIVKPMTPPPSTSTATSTITPPSSHSWWSLLLPDAGTTADPDVTKELQDKGMGAGTADMLHNAVTGTHHALLEPTDTIEHAIRKIPWLGPLLGQHAGLDKGIAADDAELAKPVGTGGGAGEAAVGTGEFLVGDKELQWLGEGLTSLVKGANYADRLKIVQPILKVAADHPHMARTLMTALRNATVGGTQAVLHGEDLPTAAKTAAVTGLAGGATEGATEGLAFAREGAAKTAQEAADYEAIPEVKAERTAAMVADRQATAQGQVKDVARQATEDALNRLNAARTPTTVTTPPATVAAREGADTIDEGIRAQNARQQLGSMAATVPDRLLPRNPIVEEIGHRAALVPGRLWDEVGNAASAETTVPPTFEPVDAQAHAAEVNSFGDGAEKLRAAADPVYKKIDTATGGQFAELQADRAAGYRTNDPAKIAKAEDGIDAMFAKKPAGISGEDYAAAKSAWRDSKVLDKLHSATEGAFNGISEEMAAQPGTSQRLLKPGDSGGGTLQKRIGTLMAKPKMAADVERVIGKEGVTNLYRASHLVSTPEIAAETQRLAEEVAKQFPAPKVPNETAKAVRDVGARALGTGVGAAMGHAADVPYWISGPAGAGAAEVTRYVLRKMVTSPRIGQLMEFAIKSKVAPKVAAGLIAGEIQRERGQGGGLIQDEVKQ